jgi:hypothetical protein
MYILKTKTKTKSTPDGGSSFTYRIVESFRVGTLVKQRILLNLGKNFDIEHSHWPLLVGLVRTKQIILRLRRTVLILNDSFIACSCHLLEILQCL